MTRGLGTALGIAAATLVYAATHGITAVAWFLAVLTVVGAALAVIPRRRR